MAGYNDIDEFRDYLAHNRVRRLTVIEYRSRGGVWSTKSGEIMRHPEFGGHYTATVRIRLHQMDGDRFIGVTEVFLTCDYLDQISFETSEDGSTGVLHGFTHNEYRVDIVAHRWTP